MRFEIRIFDHDSEEYRLEVALRSKVLREPLGLTFSEEELAKDAGDFHIGVFCDDLLIGCLLLVPKANQIVKMRQVAIAAAEQGRGIGRALVEFAENFAKAKGFRTMELNARETAVPFYLALNYSVEGEPFQEVTVPHRRMFKVL
jgi:predicted GNAT family N-acyltransferase